MDTTAIDILTFSNQTKQDRALLRRFVDFAWQHYQQDPHYIPLLDYEYLGFKLIGMTGFFEPQNLFFEHGEMAFFLAVRRGQVVGRCNAFVNHNHNEHWKDKVGFFGQFESIDDQRVADALLRAAAKWLKMRGMDTMRGPQNLPVNEATPGIMIEGFDSQPVIYYHYNKPYYKTLLENAGFQVAKRYLSWEVTVARPVPEKVDRVVNKVIKRYNLLFEFWKERPLAQRKKEMFDIYNDAWNNNYGFVPFTQAEFYSIIDDMQLVMDSDLFLFCYVDNELAAFFGGVPNITERMRPIAWCPRCELLRAAKMLLTKGKTKGFRTGYLGIKKRYQGRGLDGVMLWKQHEGLNKKGKYAYSNLGWTLEDNMRVIRMAELFGGKVVKVYAIYEKKIPLQ